MRDRLVAATRPMPMVAASMLRSAADGVQIADFYNVLVNMSVMRMEQTAIFQVVNMTAVADGSMTAARAMAVRGVRIVRAGHKCFPLPFCSRLLRRGGWAQTPLSPLCVAPALKLWYK